MSVERIGQFIQFMVAGEGGGTRTLARLSALQVAAEADCIGNEILLTVANRTYRVDATLDQLKNLLADADRAHAKAGRR